MEISEKNAIEIIKAHGGIMRTKDLLEAKVHPRIIKRLYETGRLEKIKPGMYRLSDMEFSSHQSLIEVAKAIPEGVICLLSALSYYDLTTQNPAEVYVAIERDRWSPDIAYPPIRKFFFSGEAFHSGIVEEKIDGHIIHIYCMEKTINDCIKFRNRIGKDIAIEALRDYLRRKNRDLELLLKYAKICRVERLTRQYIEAMV